MDVMFDFRRFSVSALLRLGNLSAALYIYDESVRQDLSVGCLSTNRDAGEQRRLEPSAMLIGRFDVNVGWKMQRRVSAQNGLMAHSGINPDIQGVIATREGLW